MGLDQDRPVSVADPPAIGLSNGKHGNTYGRIAAGEQSDQDNGIAMGDYMIEIPVYYNYTSGTHVMGDPAVPFMNSNNRPADPRLAPQVKPGPYDSDGTTPPPTPSGRCKGPFVPSFKSVTKFLSFPSYLLAQVDAFMERLSGWSKDADSLGKNIWGHMKLGSNMSEAVWGKLRLGAKIVTEGGVDNLFKRSFSVGPGEKLLKTSACYLSTTTGPVVGLLFISTEKLTFCSDRPLSFTCPEGGIAWSYYRVVIPRGRVSSVNPCENVEKPAEKYIQIRTVDDHEFWFMGFVNYHKALKHLQEAVTVRSSQ